MDPLVVRYRFTGCSERKESVPAEHVRDHLDFCFCCCDLFLGGGLRATATEKERHVDLVLCVAVLM